jgi:hypothetical protein
MDIKNLRHTILQHIKEQLRKAEGGEGGNIRSLNLFLHPGSEERQVYEAAVYYHEEDRFKKEVQKIADDFAIDLPDEWAMKIIFTGEPPAEAGRLQGTAVSLYISTTKEPINKQYPDAYVSVLNGEAEKEHYPIRPGNHKIYIGREKKVRTADGFFRENTIAFNASATNDSNKYVSRQHAHIEWNREAGSFFLFADEGGIPPGNKIKIRQQDGSIVKLQNTHIGHQLEEGDQVILGDSALLKFSYFDPAEQ